MTCNVNNLSVLTRQQKRILLLKEANSEQKIQTMAAEKPDLANILSLISPFDGKRDKNVKFYLDQFENLVGQVDLTDAFKLNILKAKFVGEARERLASDEELNSEQEFPKFKERLLEIFEKKESFSDSQAKFNSVKQKPNQTIAEFIKEFNAVSAAYLKASGQAKDAGANNLFELIKTNKFLEAISPNLSLELRKLGIKEFSVLCEKAKIIENAFNAAATEEINTVKKKSESHDMFCNNILKINADQSEVISELRKEINNLKLENQSFVRRNNVEKFCNICNLNNHDLAECWFNLRNQSSRRNFITNSVPLEQELPAARDYGREVAHSRGFARQNWTQNTRGFANNQRYANYNSNNIQPRRNQIRFPGYNNSARNPAPFMSTQRNGQLSQYKERYNISKNQQQGNE